MVARTCALLLVCVLLFAAIGVSLGGGCRHLWFPSRAGANALLLLGFREADVTQGVRAPARLDRRRVGAHVGCFRVALELRVMRLQLREFARCVVASVGD
ncbi:hypothetical protein ACFPRL_36595 [Pseudoclavibacter helvolus]